MSKFKTISVLRRELENLNREIDSRIVRGRSYDKLAEKHKMIVRKIDDIYGQMSLARTFRFLSLL